MHLKTHSWTLIFDEERDKTAQTLIWTTLANRSSCLLSCIFSPCASWSCWRTADSSMAPWKDVGIRNVSWLLGLQVGRFTNEELKISIPFLKNVSLHFVSPFTPLNHDRTCRREEDVFSILIIPFTSGERDTSITPRVDWPRDKKMYLECDSIVSSNSCNSLFDRGRAGIVNFREENLWNGSIGNSLSLLPL